MTARVYEARQRRNARAAETPVPSARRATDDRGHRPHAGDPGAADPAVRHLRALGHRHLHRPGPVRSQAQVRGEARCRPRQPGPDRPRPRRPRATTPATNRATPTTTRSRRARRAARGRARSARSTSRRSASTGCSSRACSSPTSTKGPGHYPGTPLPGQIGNAAIAGHRTTHGAPFYRINELAKGDRIKITDVRRQVQLRRHRRIRSRCSRPTTTSSPTPRAPSSRSRAATRGTPRPSASSCKASSCRS